MSEKQKTDVIYALADYKQLVLAYRSKYTELIKAVTFWRASVVWLAVFICLLVGFLVTGFFSYKNDLLCQRTEESSLTRERERLSAELRDLRQELASTQSELQKKEDLIQQLEKNISTASKKTLEKLLKETE
jgi:septal ring factor EnvC (AmiA/AmiB activator)